MSNSPPLLDWWGYINRELLSDSRLREVLFELIEGDKIVLTGKPLAADITKRRRALVGREGLDDDEEYSTQSLSSDLQNYFEETGLVQRIPKASTDSQSIIFVNDWLADFLRKQDLVSGNIRNPEIDELGKRVVDYLYHVDEERIESAKDSNDSPRLLPSLEAVLYAWITEHTELSDKEIYLDVGKPENLDEESEAIFESFYEDNTNEDNKGRMPELPQHRDYVDDDFTDYVIAGEVKGVESVHDPRALRREIGSQLALWAAAALEVNARSGDEDEDVDQKLSEDAIEQREAITIKGSDESLLRQSRNAPHDRFGLNVTIGEKTFRFGLYLRTKTKRLDPVSDAQDE